MPQTKEYYKEYRTRPGVSEKSRAKTKAWVTKKCSTPAGRADYNIKQAARKKKRLRDPLRWPRHILSITRDRAKRKGLPFNLEACDIVVPTVCPVLGTAFAFGAGYKDTRSPSIDRIKPHLGYVRGNIRVISLRANALRNDATAAELTAVALYAANLEKVLW